ncbi:MAG: hypothetical protein EYC62_00900 [Alphaproteobacteria bacterium]|nr:MAG: hypothetical protein EYC62_00900 [Alphaproteobacteria bacterium]
MGDAKVTDFLDQVVDCVEMIHRYPNHRDIGGKGDQYISHHYPAYIRVGPKVRHLNIVNRLDGFCRHFSVTHASPATLQSLSLKPAFFPALTGRVLSVRSLPPFRQHITPERNHP